MKKILVISHLPFSRDTNVGKTLLNLFDGYPKDSLNQLYFTENGIRAEGIRYYRVTDSEVLYALRHNRMQCGGEIETQRVVTTNFTETQSYVRSANKRRPLFLLLRDFLWAIGPWYTENLKHWLQDISPDLVFLAPGYSIFAYKVAQKIASELSVPLFVYFMEDFYNERTFSLSPFFWLRYALFRKNIRDCVKQADTVVVLNEALQTEYEKTFNKRVSVIYNPVTYNSDAEQLINSEKMGIRFLYGGSIGFDRIDILEKISESITRINKIIGYDDIRKASFFVCGRAKNYEIVERLNALENLTYGGTLTEEALNRMICEADVLVHVESFKSKYIAKTRRALSTKIPEYLASGKLILAVGPSQIESIQYLKRNGAAVTVTEIAELDTMISRLLKNELNVDEYLRNAIGLALRNHDKENNQKELYKLLVGDRIERN